MKIAARIALAYGTAILAAAFAQHDPEGLYVVLGSVLVGLGAAFHD